MTARRSIRRRRLAGVGLAFVALAGFGTGSAAQLSVGATPVGSGVAVVADCQGGTPVRVQLQSSWNSTAAAFTTTGVAVYDVSSACSGKALHVALVNAAGTALAEAALVSVNGAANPQTGLTFTRTAAAPSYVLTSAVVRAKIVITG